MEILLQQQVLKSSSKSANHKTFMDPSYPHWGWSWLERWMASRPQQNENARERELYSDHASIKRATAQAFPVRELGKSRSLRYLNLKNIPSPTALTHSRQSPSTNASRAPSVSSKGGGCSGVGEDSRSMISFQSEWYHRRRHSIAGSSARDDESLASSPSVPRYMGPTESAKAKTRSYRIPSPLGNGTPEKGSAGSAKKRLSFSSSPAGIRRHSGPPKLDISVHSEKKPSNGGGR